MLQGENPQVTLSGGTIKTSGAALSLGSSSNGAKHLDNSGTVTISGGVYQSTADENPKAITRGATSSVNISIRGTNTYFKGDIDSAYTCPSNQRLTLVTDESSEYNGFRHPAQVTADNPYQYAAGVYDADGNEVAKAEADQVAYLPVLTEGETLKLLGDYNAGDYDERIAVTGDNVTFDLNGHKITAVDDSDAYFSAGYPITFDGTITLKDSAGGGSIVAPCVLFAIGGTTTVESGIYDSASVGGYDENGDLWVNEGATVVVKGGQFTAKKLFFQYGTGALQLQGGEYAADDAADHVADGYKLEKQEDETYPYKVVEDANARAHTSIGYSVATTSDTSIFTDVVVHSDGQAYAYFDLPNISGRNYVTSLESVKVGDDEVKTVTEAGTVDKTNVVKYAGVALDDIYGKTAATITVKQKSTEDSEETEVSYPVTLDWTDYAGPHGDYTVETAATHYSGTAMSAYEYDADETLIRYEDGHDYLVLDWDNWASHFASSLVYVPRQTGVKDNTTGEDLVFYGEPKEIDSEGIKDTGCKNMIFEIKDGHSYTASANVYVSAMGFTVGFTVDLTPTMPAEDLPSVIDRAEKKAANTSDYTAASLADLNKAVEDAKAVQAKTDATEEETDAAKKAVNDASRALVSVTGLRSAIESAQGLDKSAYTDDGAKAIDDAVATAQGVLDKAGDASNALTKDDISAAVSALNTAVSGAEKKEEPKPENKGAFQAGTYQIASSLKNASDTSKDSMAAPVLKDTATMTVADDGTATVTLSFNDEATIRGIVAHPTGIDIYGEDGKTPVETTVQTVDKTNMYNHDTNANDATGKALTEVTFTLPYVASDGVYQGHIYSDFMDANVALQLDFSNVPRNENTDDAEREASLEALNKAIADAQGVSNDEGTYTADSYQKLQDAIVDAQKVAADENATKNDLDKAAQSVADAKDALKKADSGKSEVVEDGTYTVPVRAWRAAEDKESMMDSALDGAATVTVKDGKATYSLSFKGVTIGTQKGHLIDLWVQPAGSSDTGAALETDANKAEVTATSTDTGLDGNQGTFNRTFQFRRDAANESEVRVRVHVDAMEGFNQDALLRFDWKSATKTSDSGETDEQQARQASLDALNKAIEEAKTVKNDDGAYTADSYKALTDAIESGQKAADDSASTKDQLDAAAKAITDAQSALVKQADADAAKARQASLGALNKAIEDAKAVTKSGWTSESYADLADAVAAGEKTAADSKATKDDLDKAAKAITDAKAGLRRAGRSGGNTGGSTTDTTAAQRQASLSSLRSVISGARGVSNDGGTYTAESFKALTDAIAAGQKVADSSSSTRAQLDAAAKAITDAEAGLKTAKATTDDDATAKARQASLDALNASLAGAGVYDNSKGTYTAESFKSLTDAIAAAQKAAADSSSTKAQLDAAAVDIANAEAGLKVAEAKTDDAAAQRQASLDTLNAIVTAAGTVSNDDGAYTKSSYARLTSAIAAAQKTAADSSSTRAQLDAAAVAVANAQAALEVAPANVKASSVSVDGVTYVLSGKTATAAKVSKNAKTAVIDGVIKVGGRTYKVTKIKAKAFKGLKRLQSVTVGKNIKSIGKQAFQGDKKLAKVTFKGKKLAKVGKNAFKGVSKSVVFKAPKSKAKAYKKLLKKSGLKNFKIK